jgi:hypothetical protein
MTLRTIFEELYANAAIRATAERPGESFRQLGKGAAILVRAQGRKRQVILSRRGAPVGEAEIATFRRDGQIPEHAARVDYPATRRMHFTALTWEEAQLDLFDD